MPKPSKEVLAAAKAMIQEERKAWSSLGGKARTSSMTSEERVALAKKANAARKANQLKREKEKLNR